MRRFVESWDGRSVSVAFRTGAMLAVSLVLLFVTSPWELRLPFVHAGLEAFGSFLACIVAWHALTTYQINPREPFRAWIGYAFLNMGILDGFHALVAPGEVSVWFHSCAAFVGGMLSLLVWMPDQVYRRISVAAGVSICAVGYPLFGLLSVRYPQLIPPMIEEGGFSLLAKALNVGGGLAFFGTAVWFLRSIPRNAKGEGFRQFSCYASIGLSEVLFVWSALWDPMWWWWHGIRFLTYGIVACDAKADFEQGLIRKTKADTQADENERFRLVVESAPCGMLMAGPDGAISLVNNSLEVMFGYDRHELIGKPIECLLPERFRHEHPASRDLFFRAPSVRAMGQGRDLFGLRKDGSEFPVEVGLNPISDDMEHRVLATVVDISERKRAEEEFRLVVESAPCGMLMVNEDGMITLVNGQVEALFGYSRSELVGAPVELLLPERFRSGHPGLRRSYFRASSARAMGQGRELFGLRKDGAEFSVEVGLNPIQTRSGIAVLATIVDISERKRIDRQVRLSEFSVNHVSVPTMWVTYDARVVRVNSAACKMMGYSEEELLRLTVHDFNPEFPAEIWPAHWQELKAKQHMSFESNIRHKDGHLFPVEVWINFLAFEGREYNVAFVTDITERKQAEERLAQERLELSRSNDELEQFAYVASHDLQEPLRMVSSYCGLLSRRYKGTLDQDADEFIQFAVDGAKRMKLLIDELLSYSRVGRRGKPFVMVDLLECVQAGLANLDIAVKEAGAMITCEALPRVFGDPIQLTQVFQNLIGNALKFRGARRPLIRISARNLTGGQDPSQWTLSVQDNGIGFEQQFSERVFVIFQRLHTREEYQGNGMGLAITKKIVERHGGRIWVESTPGEGTTFHFTLRGQPAEHVMEVA